MDNIQLMIIEQSTACEIAAAHDAHQRIEATDQCLLTTATAVQQITFGVQKPISGGQFRFSVAEIFMYLYVILLDKPDQIFDNRLEISGIVCICQPVPQLGNARFRD